MRNSVFNSIARRHSYSTGDVAQGKEKLIVCSMEFVLEGGGIAQGDRKTILLNGK